RQLWSVVDPQRAGPIAVARLGQRQAVRSRRRAEPTGLLLDEVDAGVQQLEERGTLGGGQLGDRARGRGPTGGQPDQGGRATEEAHSWPSTRTTCTTRGPCTPTASVFSTSAVRLGPVTSEA